MANLASVKVSLQGFAENGKQGVALISSAADEVDDLYFITFGKQGYGPIGAANDAAIDFDGEAVAFEFEFGKQIGNS